MATTGYIRDNGYKADINFRKAALRDAGCEEVIIENASKEQGTQTPLLDAYLDQVEEGDLLVAHNLQSIGRNLEVLAKVQAALRKKNAKLKLLDEDINLRSPDSRLFMNIRATQMAHADAKREEK